jgi:phosphatidylglycerophosphate synthase
MIDGPFRAMLPKAVVPLLKLYKKLGLTPNHLTVAAFLTGLLSAYLVANGQLLFAAAIWWCGRLLDGTDGIYARANGQTSSFGAFLDILLDMAAYSAMLIGFDLFFPALHFRWLIIMSLYVLCITGALALGHLENQKNIGKKTNRGLRLATGIAEGGETGIAYTLFLLFPSSIALLSGIWIIVLSITVVARLALAKIELK